MGNEALRNSPPAIEQTLLHEINFVSVKRNVSANVNVSINNDNPQT